MAKKAYVRDNVPLSRFGVLVAQLESIVASAAQQPPDALLCFDLLSDLISAISDEPKESILLWQRKCEDALYSLLVLGARRPVRHLASVAMARIIMRGDPISIYSRASSLQGFLSDGKRSEPQRVAGAAQCLGELYRFFGRRITSGLPETTSIASKLMRFHEEYVRKEALYMLQNALEGSGGTAVSTAYSEAFRLIMRSGASDKSLIIRKAAARCLKAFADIGGPGLGVTELDSSATSCVKALDDPVSSVRDAFAEALGSLLALGMNPAAQVQPRGKIQSAPSKKWEGGLQKHLISPFVKARSTRSRTLRIGLTLSWVSFLQVIRLKYLHPDSDLQEFTLQVMEMLRADTNVDAYALACVLYILRVGLTDQMTEPTQRSFLVVLGKQLQSHDSSAAMRVAALRTLSYTLKTLGEVPVEFKVVLDDTVVGALSHSSQLVRVEAALTLRALAEVDPTCVGGLASYGVTTLTALRENISFEKGSKLKAALDWLHGQATVLAALVSISPNLPLGYPAGLPKSVLTVSRKMLTESSRNPGAATVEREAGWLLLSSLLASMPKEELEDQVFDILTLWAPFFSGSLEHDLRQTADLTSKLCVWASAVDALTAFIRSFISPCSVNDGILLQPVLVYLSRVLSSLSSFTSMEPSNAKPAMSVLIIRTLVAFQSLSDPMAYRSDHAQLLQICTAPFKNASAFEESSCLKSLLDKRDAWLGPWIPGRAWFEDELRAFQGGKDGLTPCVWDPELPSFPQPETVGKTLVNQMLLCFGVVFAFQDSSGMLSLLGMMEQCLKAGRKQAWHSASVTNICVGLLYGLKVLLTFRPQPLASEILSSLQTIFQGIIAEGDICASQRRASCECLGLLTRLGSDAFTVRMTKSLLGDLTVFVDSNYAGSVALALGCIHRSAGGMALSSMVPATVSSVSLLAKSSVAGLQIWSLHGLLLTIEAAGLSYVSHVQATLSLALEILLAEENGWVDLQQGVGRLINAIVAVLGPELAPDSIFFSRCKSVISEVSSCQETATLLESVRFTQQLALFAPQALSIHSHVQTLLPTLSSRQPALRHLAVSTLHHLVEKDPDSVTDEKIEDTLFHMLDEETDPEIGNLVRNTIMRLQYASCPWHPSRWISICRKMVLAASTGNSEISDGIEQDQTNSVNGVPGDDDDNMVSSAKAPKPAFGLASAGVNREKHLRYRTKVFAAECLSHMPMAVGRNPAHFDLFLARKQPGKRQASVDWLVLQLQELISLAYQISIIQFENMQPVGVGLLYAIIDKFETAADPELPGHLLLEQYQAQLVSALRTALGTNSGPILLEAGLQLATKILTSGIIHGDQAAVKRIFSLISRPLDDFKDIYYPSFAEWVSCKIKIRLLAAHASLKCYTYSFLRRYYGDVPHESLALLPLFSKSSSVLGKHWISLLKDYCFTQFNMYSQKNWKPFLEGIQSSLVSSRLKSCLEESWPVILQAVVLDAVPVKYCSSADGMLEKEFISGYRMVELQSEEFHFIWGLALIALFQGQNTTIDKQIVSLAPAKADYGDSVLAETTPPNLKIYEVVLPVFQCLCTESFFVVGFSTLDICSELLQVLTLVGYKDDSWNTLAVAVLAQIVQKCPDNFLNVESFACLAMELCLAFLFETFQRTDATTLDMPGKEDFILQLLTTTKVLLKRVEPKFQLKSTLLLILIGFKCIRGTSSESSFSKINEFVASIGAIFKSLIDDHSHDEKITTELRLIIGACQNAIYDLLMDCMEGIHLLGNQQSNLRRLVHTMIAFCLDQALFFASLVYISEHHQRNECINSNAVLRDFSKSVGVVFRDSNIQVQAIGLQVLKNALQEKVTTKGNSFVVILTGELFSDVVLVIQNALKKPVTRESAALVGECLRTLMLMQTLPRTDECQKCLLNLLLESIVMVMVITQNGPSQDASDLRSAGIRLVSSIAQIPSAAVHLKDVLLGMPPAHRQQIQDIIRAFVSQEQSTPQDKSRGQALEIKLPLQSEGTKVQTAVASSESAENLEDEEDDWDEDDDWDAFQSIPASTNATNQDKPELSPEEQLTSEQPAISESNTSNDDFQQYSTSDTEPPGSSSIPSIDETVAKDHQDVGVEEVITESASIRKETEFLHEGEDDAAPTAVTEPAPSDSLIPVNVAGRTEETEPASSQSLNCVDDAEGFGEEQLVINNVLCEESQLVPSVGRLLSDFTPAETPVLQDFPQEDDDGSHHESLKPDRDSELVVSAESENAGQHLQNTDCSELKVSAEENVVMEQHLETDENHGKEISIEEQTHDGNPEMGGSSGLLGVAMKDKDPLGTAKDPRQKTGYVYVVDDQDQGYNDSMSCISHDDGVIVARPVETPDDITENAASEHEKVDQCTDVNDYEIIDKLRDVAEI